jgi:ADP-heptose:LPS heptosyltransferase
MTEDILEQLGVKKEEVLKHYDTLDDLRQSTPGMVLATAVKDFWFSIDRKKKQLFKRGSSRILSLFLYDKLKADPEGNQCLEPAKDMFKDVYNPYTGQNLTNKTLLVWRTGGIGDLLFIQPNLRYLKKKYPTCKIWFGCSPAYYPLINNWKCLDKIVTLPTKYEIFKQADYQVTFEGVIERCNEAKITNAYKLFSKWMGLADEIPDSDLVPIQYLKKTNNLEVLKKLDELGVKPYEYITFQIRTSSPVRTPGLDVWKNLMLPLLENGHKLVICDSSHMSAKIDQFIKTVIPTKYRDNVINFCTYAPSIDYCASLINFSNIVISPDSSYTHISAALGVPVLGVYGAFPGHIRMSLYKNADWIEPEQNSTICEFGGKGCCLHGHKPCPVHEHGMSPCFNEIDFEEAHKKILKLIKIREEMNDG